MHTGYVVDRESAVRVRAGAPASAAHLWPRRRRAGAGTGTGSGERKRLHHYLYLIDPEFGSCTCDPGLDPPECQICINGREWWPASSTRPGIGYLR